MIEQFTLKYSKDIKLKNSEYFKDKTNNYNKNLENIKR